MILGAWVVLLAWTGGWCAFGSRLEPGQPVALLFGMPRWVVLGVIVPWLGACGFTAWFAMGFMRDTDLDPDEGEPESTGREEAS